MRLIFLLLLVFALGLAGCDSRSPGGPLAPTPAPPAVSLPAPPAGSLSAPTITAIFPDRGSTGGDTRAKISGTGFQPGATVRLGGTIVGAVSNHREPPGTVLYVDTAAHAAAAVDVVVTNPDGQSGRLTNGYTYAPQGSFDFNGNWSGYGNAGQDIPIGFTIENNLLIAVRCDSYATVNFSPPVVVTDGQFSFSRDDGVAVSGRIVSASAAVGTINLAPCTDTRWGAVKR